MSIRIHRNLFKVDIDHIIDGVIIVNQGRMIQIIVGRIIRLKLSKMEMTIMKAVLLHSQSEIRIIKIHHRIF
jgi:hypothetical protein